MDSTSAISNHTEKLYQWFLKADNFIKLRFLILTEFEANRHLVEAFSESLPAHAVWQRDFQLWRNLQLLIHTETGWYNSHLLADDFAGRDPQRLTQAELSKGYLSEFQIRSRGFINFVYRVQRKHKLDKS